MVRIMVNDWNDFHTRPLPAKREVLIQATRERLSFPKVEEISDDWILVSQLYRYLFSALLLDRTGLERIDRRIAEQGILPAPKQSMSFYQKYDMMNLSYFYIRMMARIDRLDPKEIALLEQAARQNNSDTWIEAIALVEKTFDRIMIFDPDNRKTMFEPLPTIHGDYSILGSEVPLAMRSVAEFAPDGSLVSEEREQERIRVFSRVWRQIDTALTKDLGCPTRTAIECFLI